MDKACDCFGLQVFEQCGGLILDQPSYLCTHNTTISCENKSSMIKHDSYMLSSLMNDRR